MNRIIKYGLLVSCFFLASCQDFLEPKSQSEYTPKLVKSLDELLLGEVYMGPGVSDGMMYSVLGLFDDDVASRPDIVYDDAHEGDVERARLAFSWSRDMIHDFGGYNVYGEVYKKIVGCNSVLDYLDEVQGTEEEKARVKLQALAFRGYYYFHLVNLYGKPYSSDPDALGVPLQLISKLSTKDMPRNTVREVYGQIVEDLLEAERLFKTLPEEEWNVKNNRVNLPFIQLMLSRVYLYMENWEEALAYGEKVINNYDYEICDLTSKPLPDPYQEISYPDYFNWNNLEVMFLFGNQGDVLALPLINVMSKIDENYKNMYINVASDSLINAYEETDLRKSHYLVWERIESGGMPVYRVPVSKLEVGTYFGITFGWERGRWGVAFKVTEGYLNAAEAAAMLYKKTGDGRYLTKSRDWLDQLRGKRFIKEAFQQITITDPDALVECVRNERRLEFCFENHRWFDLRRYGMNEMKHVWYKKDGVAVEYTLEKNDPGYTLLIPKDAMRLNPSLVQNEMRK